MRKTVFGVSYHVQHKPVCIVTEKGQRLEILDSEGIGIVLFEFAESKVLISFAVTS